MRNLIQEYSATSQYYAPRGRDRMIFLGEQISQRHLNYKDRLIGIVGDAGSGKSSLIKGMFPGLELSNDDDVINPRKIMQVRDITIESLREASTFHLDMRFQLAFTQMYEIVDFVQAALNAGKRLVIEHFNQLYPALGMNADIIVGIGEEIIVSRPSIFGPEPQSIYNIVHTSLKFRKMAHTVEDITIEILNKELGIDYDKFFSSDVRNGFVLNFTEKIDLDFEKLSARISDILAEDFNISYVDEDHVQMGDRIIGCNGPRLHVTKTSQVENFNLIRRFIHDPKTNTFCLVGLVGEDDNNNIKNRNTSYFLKRKE